MSPTTRGGRGRPDRPPRADRAARAGGPPGRGRAGRAEPVDVHDPDGVRLQKVLAEAGIGSRRACEQMIAGGRVSVDGTVVRELGVRVDPARAVLHVDGMRLQLDTTRAYLALNKPRGVVATMSDDRGRPCLGDLVAARGDRLFHVGRLDTDTEGLLLLTNDGDFSHRMQHPSYEVPKTYLATVPGPVPRDLGRRLRAGIPLDDGPVAVDSFKLVDSVPGHALVELVLHEGRKHVVRRLLAEVGHPVERLVRTHVGAVALGDLLPGRTRALTREELGTLMAAVGL